MFATITGTGSGTAPVVNLTFPFINKTHIKATVNGVAVTLNWTGAAQVTFAAVVAAAAAWVVYRETPTDASLVDFSDGSLLTEADLDLSVTASRYRDEELKDKASIAATGIADVTSDLAGTQTELDALEAGIAADISNTAASAAAAALSASSANTAAASASNSAIIADTAAHSNTRAQLAAIAAPAAQMVRVLSEAGREGTFHFTTGDLSAKVTADPSQGIYVAPASAPTGASGAWVRKFTGRVNVKWFGAVGDDTTNDGPAFLAALAYMNGIGVAGGSYGYPGRSSPSLFIPAGRYFLGLNTLDIVTTMIIEGEGVGSEAAASTVLRWSAGATGIRIQAATTSGDTTSGLSLSYSGDGSIIRNLALIGGYAGVDGNFHGINMRARATIQDVFIDLFQGEGIYIHAVAPTDGNANNWRIHRTTIQRTRTGLFVDGPDVNAGVCEGLSVNACRAWGVWDSSFLGNTYVAAHVAGCTSGAYKTDDPSARNVFIGCYSESGQPQSSLIAPTLVIGGSHGAGINMTSFGGVLTSAGASVQAEKDFTVVGTVTALGAGHSFGPQSGTALDLNVYLDTTNVHSVLNFRKQNGSGTFAFIDGNSSFGLINNVSAGLSHRFSVTGTGDIHITDATGLNLQPGMALKYNGANVLTAGVLTAAASPAFTGDVTKAAGSLAQTIAASAVTYAKMQNVSATARLLGRASAGAGVVEEIALLGGLAMSGTSLTISGALTPTSVAATGLLTTTGLGIGYATGAGGTVVQAANKTNGVTLNKASGSITMNAAALASAALVTFTVTNSAVAATDTINLNLASGPATAGTYRYWIEAVAAGSFKITVENRSAGSLSEALVFNFAVVKAVTA